MIEPPGEITAYDDDRYINICVVSSKEVSISDMYGTNFVSKRWYLNLDADIRNLFKLGKLSKCIVIDMVGEITAWLAGPSRKVKECRCYKAKFYHVLDLACTSVTHERCSENEVKYYAIE